VSTSWPTPDPRRASTLAPTAGPAFGLPYELPAPTAPSATADASAGLLAAVVSVLLGGPVGLLWAALAPRADVVVVGQAVQLAEPGSSAFIAGDGVFLLAVTLAGAVGGVLAWRLGRAHGPAVVVGLTVGGLLAAYVAMVVGQQVGLEEFQRAVRSGRQGVLELTLRLRAREALVGWPVGALLGYLGASLLRGR
jgi:hypothetical protein